MNQALTKILAALKERELALHEPFIGYDVLRILPVFELPWRVDREPGASIVEAARERGNLLELERSGEIEMLSELDRRMGKGYLLELERLGKIERSPPLRRTGMPLKKYWRDTVLWCVVP